MSQASVTPQFTQILPKIELHAHLTGSISPQCLHEIYLQKRSQNLIPTDLPDPLIACAPSNGSQHHDILSFFPIFDKYIYNLCNDIPSISFATKQVLRDFEDDGVRYLELRTTPRESPATGLTKEQYIDTVLDAIESHGRDRMPTYLILSIDRRNTAEQALQVVELALKYRDRGVVAIDLCGNPLKGDVRTFREAFSLARQHGLGITLHFAEVPESSAELELETLLSYRPDRIGHVIHVPPLFRDVIEERRLGLELCLSCNVHAKMTTGGFAGHHLGEWYGRDCPIALCTDDVGVFGSPVSNEYFLAAKHFNLSRKELIKLVQGAISTIFGDEDEKRRMVQMLDEFEKNHILNE